MAAFTKTALAVAALACLSALAAAEGGWAVPAIPAGRRAQFYLQKADGGYHYGYDTGDGNDAEAAADARNEVAGRYAFVAADGRRVALSYTAGTAGFVPQLDAANAGSSSWQGNTGSSGRSNSGAGFQSIVVNAAPSAVASGASAPFRDPDYDENADASYSFGFDTASYQRQEAADSRGNVQGRYAYSSPEGGSHSVSYIAGEGTGFVITGDSSSGGVAAAAPAPAQVFSAPGPIPVPAPALSPSVYSGPASNAQASSGPDGSYSFSFNTGEQTRRESADANNNVRGSYSFKAADDGQTRKVDYVAGSSTGFVAKGDHLPVAPSALGSGAAIGAAYSSAVAPYSGPASNAQVSSGSDGSYSFSFSSGEHSRHESADAQNNVRGSYSYKSAGDGQTKRVDYQAGAGIGFVATGDHLPSPVVPVAPALYSAPVAPVVPALYSAPAAPVAPALYSAPIAPVAPSRSYSPSAVSPQGATTSDGSYSFSYTTGEQSRQEAADAQNNVVGSYSFRSADDGQTRRVDYQAGAATGFVAKGDHLPVAPVGPAAISSVASYSAPGRSTPGSASNTQASSNVDGSYSFSYNTGEQSRQESSDANNNVQGSYSFKAIDDGQTRRVDYIAGSTTGFVASGDHLPKAQPAPVAGGAVYAAPAITGSRIATPNAANANAAKPDGSYSFSYDAGDHARQESSDGSGNVRGSFTFVAKDDKQSRRVDYSAGSGTGFLASGAHIPSAPGASDVAANRYDSASISAPGAYATGAGSYSSGAGSYTSGSAASGSAGAGDASGGDASYAYSYRTDSSGKTETSDAQGNVRGEYSYLGADGVTRKISYSSIGDAGFIATGDVNPIIASDAGSGAAVNTATQIARAGSYSGSQGGSYSSSHRSSYGAAHSNAASRVGGAVVNQYLPPQSPQKYGYVYDTKA